MKQKAIGLAMCLPLLAMIPVLAKDCHRGGDVRNASGNVMDNLLTLVFILSLPLAFVGVIMLFGGGAGAKKK